MGNSEIMHIRHFEGQQVIVRTEDQTIDALLVSACRGTRQTLWLLSGETDSFLPLARVKAIALAS